jgi:hypothetical protein
MNKHQKLWLGAGVVAVAGYFYWKSKQPKVAFVKAGMAGNAKAGFLAGKVAPVGSNGAFKKAGFLAGNVKPVGSQSGVFAPSKASFADQATSGDAKFGKMVGFATANASGAARNVPTENVNTNPVLNPFFKVKGAHVGTPKLWATP